MNAFGNSILSSYANLRLIILEYGNLSGHGWPLQGRDFSDEIQVQIFEKLQIQAKIE